VRLPQARCSLDLSEAGSAADQKGLILSDGKKLKEGYLSTFQIDRANLVATTINDQQPPLQKVSHTTCKAMQN
jgi:hypothetical protein